MVLNLILNYPPRYNGHRFKGIQSRMPNQLSTAVKCYILTNLLEKLFSVFIFFEQNKIENMQYFEISRVSNIGVGSIIYNLLAWGTYLGVVLLIRVEGLIAIIPYRESKMLYISELHVGNMDIFLLYIDIFRSVSQCCVARQIFLSRIRWSLVIFILVCSLNKIWSNCSNYGSIIKISVRLSETGSIK